MSGVGAEKAAEIAAKVETFVRDGETIILASDRDSGLWIFQNTDE